MLVWDMTSSRVIFGTEVCYFRFKSSSSFSFNHSSTLKTETTDTCETLETTYQATCYIPEDYNLNIRPREKFQSHESRLFENTFHCINLMSCLCIVFIKLLFLLLLFVFCCQESFYTVSIVMLMTSSMSTFMDLWNAE
jgi:hypothetical protein